MYIHDNTPAPFALDSCARTALFALRGPNQHSHRHVDDARLCRPDWAHATPRGDKTSAHRPSSDPVLYVCHSYALHAQPVFNLATFKFMVVGNVHLSIHPLACSLLLAGTALHKPFGFMHEPTQDENVSRLSRLLNWLPLQRTPWSWSTVRSMGFPR